MGAKLLGYVLCFSSLYLCAESEGFKKHDNLESSTVQKPQYRKSHLSNKSFPLNSLQRQRFLPVECSLKCNEPNSECGIVNQLPACVCKTGFVVVTSETGKRVCKACSLECSVPNSECGIVNQVPTCICKSGFVADPTEGNKLVCKVCDCGEGEESCQLDTKSGNQICTCKDKYQPTKDFQTCKKCDCGTGEKSCALDDSSNQICTCNDKYKPTKDKKACKLCDCGEGEKSCDLDNSGNYICSCKEKYILAENKMACILCDCGENYESCRFKKDKKKLCVCKERYGDKNGTCTECGCGEYAKSCIFKENKKECICDPGYELKEETCKEQCNPTCEQNEHERCGVVEGKPVCICKDGYVNETSENKCKSCDCGMKGKCSFENETKQCSCEDKYSWSGNPDDSCQECDCGDLGTCSITNDGVKKCDCGDEYIEKDGRCIDVCLENPCKNGGTCRLDKKKTTFACECTEDFDGETCETISFCKTVLNNFCPKDCRLDNKTNSGYCYCKENHFFNFESKLCEEIDQCPLMLCRYYEICKNSRCHCKEGFAKEGNDTECRRILDMRCNKGQFYDAKTKRCRDAVCIPGFEGHNCIHKCDANTKKCMCHTGFKGNGTHCELEDKKEKCDLSCSPGVCVKTKDKNDSTCECPFGYKFENKTACKKACEGGNSSLPGICPGNKCDSKSDKFKCSCTEKYKYDENGITCLPRKRCLDDDEDALKNCTAKRGYCVEKDEEEKGYVCACPSGFEMHQDICTEKCQIPKHMQKCALQNKECFVNEKGDASCQCGMLQYKPIDGSLCQFAPHIYKIDLPLVKEKVSKFYANHAPRGQFPGFLSTARVPDIPLELRQRIMESMNQFILVNHKTEILSCKSEGGILLCTVIVSSESKMAGKYINLIHAPSTCVPQNTSTSTELCILGKGLVLKKTDMDKTTEITNMCDERLGLCGPHSNCNFNVTKEIQYECDCVKGYDILKQEYHREKKFMVRYCAEKNVCGNSDLCGATSECVNNKGSYYCKCKPGNKLKNESLPVEQNGEPCIGICSDKPCKMGRCENVANFTFFCVCDKGVVGRFCDAEDKYLKKSGSNVVVVGAVLGSILALTFIVFYVTVRKLKKRKHDYLEDNGARAVTGEAEMVKQSERQQFRQDQGMNNKGYMKD